MSKRSMRRRTFLRTMGAAAVASPFAALMRPRPTWALDGRARRFIVFYFPDGVPGPSEAGESSLWHATGGGTDFSLPELLSPLEAFRDECVFFNGLSMGSTDAGSHPGGAKKLLTAVDGGGGESIDQHLARTIGADAPFRHLYLGAQATHNGASGDKHISYTSPNVTVSPEDDPMRAFDRVFGAPNPGGVSDGPSPELRARQTVIDTSLADLQDLRSRLGSTEQVKLDLHLESLREVESRISRLVAEASDGGGSTCEQPAIDDSGYDTSRLSDPSLFPSLLRMQTDLMVEAMACGLSRVGVLQNSYHTSELIMSRFEETSLHDPGFDMRSHQASHYGQRHDFDHREFREYYNQRRWFVEQFAYLLDRLRNIPEDDGTMLDYSVVLLCTEVCDGNTHLHDNMPFVVAGRGGGRINTGRLLNFDYHRHSDLFVGLGQALGADLSYFGQASSGPLPGLLV